MSFQYTVFDTFTTYLRYVSNDKNTLNKCWTPKEQFDGSIDPYYLKVGEDGFIERTQIVLAFETNKDEPPVLQINEFKPDFEFCCIKTNKNLFFPKYPIFYELFPYNQLFLKSSVEEYKPIGVYLHMPLDILREPVPLTGNYFIMNGACFPRTAN